MPLGDADIASGIFFADFGRSVVFGSQTAKGNFDAPGKDAIFGGDTSVSDQEYRLEIGAVTFNPMPEVGAVLMVDGQRYKVRSVNPMDDGQIVELKLRRLH